MSPHRPLPLPEGPRADMEERPVQAVPKLRLEAQLGRSIEPAIPDAEQSLLQDLLRDVVGLDSSTKGPRLAASARDDPLGLIEQRLFQMRHEDDFPLGRAASWMD